MTQIIVAPVSAGELLDKLTILDIKAERIRDADKLVNVRTEQAALRDIRDANGLRGGAIDECVAALKLVNEELWVIEDEIRDCERAKDFGPRFIELARAVYHTNDRRAEIKREINLISGSGLVEEKSYAAY